MKTKKQSTHSPTPPLTHSPTPPSPLASYRDRVESAYAEVGRRQGEFIRSVCAFGALLDEVAAFLGAAHGGDHTSKSGLAELKDGTLQSWLAENCPEINYKTAMGYRSLAMKAARMLGGGTQAIAALQGRDTVAEPGTGDVIYVDAKVVKKRDELFEAADSRRKLEQAYVSYMSGDGKPGKKRSKGLDVGDESAPALTAAQEAHAEWSRLFVLKPRFSKMMRLAKCLTFADASDALELLRPLMDSLRARVKEK